MFAHATVLAAVFTAKLFSLRTFSLVSEKIHCKLLDVPAAWAWLWLWLWRPAHLLEVVAAVQVPILSGWVPDLPCPLLEDTLAVQVSTNSLVLLTIHPARLVISMLATPRFPESANLLPASMLELTLDTTTVQLTANTLVTTPTPLILAMETVIIVLSVTLPKPAYNNPLVTIPSFDDVAPVQIAADPLVLAEECSASAVEVVALPQVPIRTNMTPVVVLESAQDLVPVSVNTNSLVLAPKPFGFGLVVVAFSALPEATCNNPLYACPAPQDLLAVQVPTHTLVCTPHPTRLPVVVIALHTLPEGAYTAPLPLHVAPKNAQTISVQPNAPITSPCSASTAMEFVVELISFEQMPVFTNGDPSDTIPTTTNSLPVEMTVDAAVFAPIPPTRLVIMVLAPHVPIRTDASPMTLVISPTNAMAIQMNADTTVPSPSFAGSAMQLVIVMVAAEEVPVLAHNNPTTTSPTIQDSQAVHVPCNTAIATPTPATRFVIVALLPHLPELADDAPLALDVTPDDAQAVLVDTNAPEASPGLSHSAMQVVAELVLAHAMPVTTNNYPAITCPALQDAQPVQMAPDTPSCTPVPSGCSVIVVLLPQVPVGSDAAPLTLQIAVQGTVTIHVHADALVGSPHPTCLSVFAVVEAITLDALPVASDEHPSCTCPLFVQALPIEVPPNSLVFARPEVPVSTVIMIATEKIPECTDTAPMAVVIRLQDAQTITVKTHAPVRTPDPTLSTMEFVAVMVATNQVPIMTHHNPLHTCPTLEKPVTIQMIANALVPSPGPSTRFVIMVFLPQVPVCTDTLPMTLMVAIQGAQSVSMDSNTSESTPTPTSLPVEAVIKVILLPQMPVASNSDPTGTSPTHVSSQAVQVTANTTGLAPQPTRAFVVVVLLPQLPELADDAPLALDVTPDDAQAVLVDTNAPEASPGLSHAAMQAVVELILAHAMPVTANSTPVCPVPALPNSLPIQVSADTPITTPEPA